MGAGDVSSHKCQNRNDYTPSSGIKWINSHFYHKSDLLSTQTDIASQHAFGNSLALTSHVGRPLHMPSLRHPNIFGSPSVTADKSIVSHRYPYICHCVWSGLTRSWKMYRLLVAAMAMMFSDGCQAMCRIFLVKSRLSTPTSPRRRLPPVYTRRVRSTARGLLLSLHASRVTPRPVSLSNIRKKLLYAPVIMTLREEKRWT